MPVETLPALRKKKRKRSRKRGTRGKGVKMEKFPLGNYAMKIQTTLKNPANRNARVLLKLWEETWWYWGLAWAKYSLVSPLIPPDQRKALQREANRFRIRMKNYKAVLDLNPSVDALKFTVVRGFLTSPPKSMQIADYLFPMSFANQSDAVLEHMIDANVKFLTETPIKIAEVAKKAIEDAGDAIENLHKYELLKWGGALVGTIVGGLVVVRLTRRK